MRNLQTLWPLLLVQDLEHSLAFYQVRLGFHLVAEDRQAGRRSWCRLERDGLGCMLQQAEPEDGSSMGRGRGVMLYFVCTDLDALVDDFASRGLAIAPPVTTHYGMRQLPVTDPDGYQLCFEQPVELSIPPQTPL